MGAFATRISGRSNVVAWYRLNETSGPTLADSSGNSNSLTVYGTPTFSTSSIIPSEPADDAITFLGGQGLYRDLPAAARVQTVSVEVVANVDAGTSGILVSLEPTGAAADARGLAVSITSSGFARLRLGVVGSGSFQTATGSVDVRGADHYYAATWDGTTGRLYVDAVEVATITPGALIEWTDSGSGPSPGQLYIGGERTNVNGATPNTAFASGVIDDVVVSSATLSPTEISNTDTDIAGGNYIDLTATIWLQSYEQITPDLSAAIWLNGEVITPDLSAAISLKSSETISPDLSATINLQTGTVDLSAAINLDTSPYIDLFAPVHLQITETTDLYAGVDFNNTTIDLSATISLKSSETITPDLSAAIALQTASQSIANGSVGFWTIGCVINGVDVSDQLTGAGNTEDAEDESCLASVTLFPQPGVIDLDAYVGKPIEVTYFELDSSGSELYRETLHRGYVSDPNYDPDTGLLVLECTTDLVNALNSKDRTAIDNLVQGVWSPDVFEPGAQGYEYTTDQLRTRPAAMWHSPGGIVVTDWAAKVTADVELTDDEIDEGTIVFENATRQDLLNKVQITVDYRYQQMRQRTINCLFSITNSFCDFLINGFKLPQRSMIEGAAAGGGWTVQGEIQYVDLPPTGYYRCFPSASTGTQKYIGWGRLAGGLLLDDPDIDALCWGASWKAAKRWTQNVTERYDIIVQAPQSQADNGDIVNVESYSLTSEQDVSDWENEEDFDSVGIKSGFVPVGDSIDLGSVVLGDVARDATDDIATGRAAADLLRQVAIETAKTDELRAHRASTVRFSGLFQPFVNLTKTVRLNAFGFVAKGKVRRHRVYWNMDPESTEIRSEIDLAISRHFGSGLVTSSPTTPDAPPAKPDETNIPKRKYLPAHIGGLTTTPTLVASWDGYFTNYIYDPTNTQPFAANPTNPQATVYPEQFVCEYPEIAGDALDNVEIPATQIVDVEIPVDELVMTQ